MTNGNFEKLLQTLIEGQAVFVRRFDALESDLGDVKKSLVQLVLLEERQLNMKEAQTRMGAHIDRVEGAHTDLRADVFNEMAKLRQAINSEMKLMREAIADIETSNEVNKNRWTIFGAAIAIIISIVAIILDLK